MHRGYVHLWRRTIDSKFFSMGLKHIGLFSYLLLKANWKTGWFMGEEIKPGQFATSITHLAEILHEHRHTVKKILQDLSDCSIISRQNMSNRWVLITICKWDSYQNPETFKNPTEVQPNSNQTPTACHENATRMPQSNKDKQENHVKQGKEERAEPKRFAPPSQDDVQAYCREKGYGIDCQSFISFYECKGWMVGKNKMKDWKAAVRTWEGRREKECPPPKPPPIAILYETSAGATMGRSFQTAEAMTAFVQAQGLCLDEGSNIYRRQA